MDRDLLLKKTTQRISLLSDRKLQEIADFAEFLLQKKSDSDLAKDLREMASSTTSFHFLEEEEDLYGDSDLIEKY